MARRRSSKLNVDMFPFLSVLCSVIGVLMLFMMLVISTRVIEAEEKDVPTQAAVDDADEGFEDGIKSDDYQRLEKEIAAKELQLAQRVKDRDELLRKVRELLELVRNKSQKVAKADEKKQEPRELGAKTKVKPVADAKFPVPGGRTPVFIEVSSKGYLVQPDNVQYPPVKQTGTGFAAQFNADPKLSAYLGKLSLEQDKKYLLLLIHPSGAEAYTSLRGYLFRSRNRLAIGIEPFSSDWEFIRKKQP